MNMMKVSDFRAQAAQGGQIQMDKDSGQLKSTGTSFMGKIASWFKSIGNPGTVASENRAAMNSFIRSLAMDPKYGEKFANMASDQLSGLAMQGKPLTARTVTTMLDGFDRGIAQTRSSTRALAERFSQYDIHGDPNCFGSVFANVAGDKGFSIKQCETMDLDKLKEEISQAIQDAGENGKKTVDPATAKRVTEKTISDFFDKKTELYTAIDKFDTSESNKAALKEMVNRFPHIKKPAYLQQMVNMQESTQTLMTKLIDPESNRAKMMDELDAFQKEYEKAFQPLLEQATGADDIVRFTGDVFTFALKTSGMDKEKMNTLYSLMTSDSTKQMREGFGFVSYHGEGVTKEGGITPSALSNALARKQEFVSELATCTGELLGLTREQTMKDTDSSGQTVKWFSEIPTDIKAFVENRYDVEFPDHFKDADIDNRSALSILRSVNTNLEGIMVIGSRAKGMFPDGLPTVDHRALNREANSQVEKQLISQPDAVASQGLAKEIGITGQFMKDFVRNGVQVNGVQYGGKGMTDEDSEVQKFVDAVGGRRQAVNLSRLMHQDGDKIAEFTHLMHTGETGMTIMDGISKVISQKQDGQLLATGGSRSVTLDQDGNAHISLKHSKGEDGDLTLSMETSIQLSNIGADPKIEDVQIGLLFITRD